MFVNGELRGLTDSLGQLFVPSIAAGDALTARVRLRENPTDRQAHAAGSDRNWNYRVYITSLSLTYDANGDHPAFQPFIVGDPSTVQDLIVRRRNVSSDSTSWHRSSGTRRRARWCISAIGCSRPRS